MIIVVKLPYIFEKPLKISKYIENKKDANVQPNAVNIAPGNCLSGFPLLFGKNSYINVVMTIKRLMVTIVRISIIKSITYCITGIYSFTSKLILLPKPKSTRHSTIAIKNKIVYSAARNLRKK